MYIFPSPSAKKMIPIFRQLIWILMFSECTIAHWFLLHFSDGERRETTMAEHTNIGWELISVWYADMKFYLQLLHILNIHSTDWSQFMGEELGRGRLLPHRSWCKRVWDRGVCDRRVGQSHHGRHAQPSSSRRAQVENCRSKPQCQSGLLQVC